MNYFLFATKIPNPTERQPIKSGNSKGSLCNHPLSNIPNRGVAKKKTATLEELCFERMY